MRKNPYLAHYFGAALDSSCEEEVVNASTNFVFFPGPKHMTQRVFRPSRGPEPSKEPRTPVRTPPSNLTAGIRMPTAVARDGFPSSPPEWTNRLPPLSPSASLRSTPVEVYTGGRNLLHSDIAATPSESTMKVCISQPLPPSNVAVRAEAPGWDPIIRQSHSALAQAKQLLDVNTQASDAATPILNGVLSTVTSGERQREREEVPHVSPTKTPCEGELTLPGPTSSCTLLSSAERHTLDVNVPLQSPKVSTSAEASPQAPVVNASPREEGEDIVPSPMSSSLPTNWVSSRPDLSALQQSVAPAPLQTRCLVLMPNPDAAACALKRWSRRPPFVSPTPNRESAVSIRPTVHEREPFVVSAERPHSRAQGRKKKSASRERNRGDGLISVSSVYGILERLADVVRPQSDSNHVDSNGATGRLAASTEPRQSLNASIENRQSGGTHRKDRLTREPNVEPKALMANAPRIEGDDFFANDQREALNSVVPTSQLQPVGVTLQRSLPMQRRASSARRPSFSRAPRTPSYALPTESWLCKGAELDEGHVDSSCILEGNKTKGPLR
ncbi:putative UDP-Gal or UDP-GlcNAc-dependent glycosyltransferase [Trypanosoma conorhini]|uniref:Putative UDP-Gal or UDP-GlcNAc-dependent glycosyltransferase n=1 Tax=Trypanosoma conorhini TaxID=83891 RepID=A0A422PMK1_9TRYP|nr:putative UDP-Gal or UDP-GlcNAc-dependent glycosyltransferase [Trypanosoma conorhini]RNF18946.1 putative UDP-Gal or UDP-GlcNAc-dependent glycosyltransferase [Trypanosoma conorhini]